MAKNICEENDHLQVTRACVILYTTGHSPGSFHRSDFSFAIVAVTHNSVS